MKSFLNSKFTLKVVNVIVNSQTEPYFTFVENDFQLHLMYWYSPFTLPLPVYVTVRFTVKSP